MENNILEMRGISKEFFGVKVLKKVDFSVGYGEIHGLLGENGAGKSTLIKILCGALQAEEGSIQFCGEALKIKSPLEAYKKGIGMVFQELNLCQHLSIAENMYMYDTGSKPISHFNRKKIEKKATEELKKLGLDIDVKEIVGNLGVAKQQIVAIARALTADCKLLILDEPTSALTQHDVDILFDVMRKLKERNISIIFISHKLNEIMEITDRITVLNNGEKVAEETSKGLTEEHITQLIVGRTVENKYPKEFFEKGEELLKLDNVSVTGKLSNISFSLYKGEILGVIGLLGAGKTEIANTIFGVYGNDPKEISGEITFEGKILSLDSPNASVRNKIGYVTENRATEGLLLDHSIKDNIILSALKKFSANGVLRWKKVNDDVDSLISELKVKCVSTKQLARNLSGGNQQKVVISKWLATESKLVIFDEPTRGIDVGAKVEIYKLMNQLVSKGIGVIVLSSEVPEILGVSDRILVLKEGKAINILARNEVSEHELQQMIM